MGGLVYRLRDRLVLGVRKLLVEACFLLGSYDFKCIVHVDVIMSHGVSKVAGDQVKGNCRSRSAGLSHNLEWANNLRFMSFESCARDQSQIRPLEGVYTSRRNS
jgi:hypothetical protein